MEHATGIACQPRIVDTVTNFRKLLSRVEESGLSPKFQVGTDNKIQRLAICRSCQYSHSPHILRHTKATIKNKSTWYDAISLWIYESKAPWSLVNCTVVEMFHIFTSMSQIPVRSATPQLTVKPDQVRPGSQNVIFREELVAAGFLANHIIPFSSAYSPWHSININNRI
jgi:hypothetical protein